jgi:hypothetical protein
VFGYDRDEAAVDSVEDSNFTVTEESTSSEQYQIGVGLFFDTEGNMHKVFVPPGQIVNGKFYCDILWQLREIIQSKHPDNGTMTPGPRIMTML